MKCLSMSTTLAKTDAVKMSGWFLLLMSGCVRLAPFFALNMQIYLQLEVNVVEV